jgi:hypothetical protein
MLLFRRLAPTCSFVANRFTPITPYRPTARSFAVPAKQSNRLVIATLRSPTEVKTSMSSASSRAPAIQPVHRSISRKALSGRTSPMMMSAIWTRPPGFRTRAISATARSFPARDSRRHSRSPRPRCGRRWQPPGVAGSDLDVLYSACGGTFRCPLPHGLGHVYTDRPAQRNRFGARPTGDRY